MGEQFSVDVTVLDQTIGAIDELAAQLRARNVGDLDPDHGAFGHDGLAAEAKKFCAAWQDGVTVLHRDGEQTKRDLADTRVLYLGAEEFAGQEFAGTEEG